MADEKKNDALAKEQTNSELADAKTALDSENLSEDELNAVAGGIQICTGLDNLDPTKLDRPNCQFG